jgi:hypothetical protein
MESKYNVEECEGEEDPYREKEDAREEEAEEAEKRIEDGGLSVEQKAAVIRDYHADVKRRRGDMGAKKKRGHDLGSAIKQRREGRDEEEGWQNGKNVSLYSR